MDAIITKAALAKTLRVSKARISQYLSRGMPVRPDGKIDREAAVKWAAKNILPKTEPGESDGVGLLKAKTARELLRVHIGRLDLDERQGKLLDADEVVRAWS